jgi:aspartokinase
MKPSSSLGGFKILKDIVRISLISPKQIEYFPVKLCQALAGEKINMPYITCVKDDRSWGVNMAVDATNGQKTSQLLTQRFGKIFPGIQRSAIISIFPHKNNPEITGSLLDLLGQGTFMPDALANSPSAISLVLKEDLLSRASNALFGPFSFSAYRTPADWKLAQKGKEQLYKEVVASYQEQRPKVYGLNYDDDQEFVQLEWDRRNIGYLGRIFKEFSGLGLQLTFLATSPCKEGGKERLAFCVNAPENRSCTNLINTIAHDVTTEAFFPVAIFSMNGPHFGDRYGIVKELLNIFVRNRVDLLALNCTIASILGVVPSDQIERAVQALGQCFEIPCILKKKEHPNGVKKP